MSTIFIVVILITALFAVASYVNVKKHEKHDCVLFRFCQIRRDLMKDLRDRYDTTLTLQEWQAAQFLLKNINGIIQHYYSHRATMFNLRKVRQMIESDLKIYQNTQLEISKHRSELPKETEIWRLYKNFANACFQSFIAYTPFIRLEIVLRLLANDVAEQIVKIKKEALNEKFA